MDNEIIFPFKNDGVECGFLAAQEKDFVFKPSKLEAAIVDREKLKANLRRLVKEKKARITRAGTIDAVAVPSKIFKELFV